MEKIGRLRELIKNEEKGFFTRVKPSPSAMK